MHVRNSSESVVTCQEAMAKRIDKEKEKEKGA